MKRTQVSVVRRHCGELVQGPLLVRGKLVVALVTLPMAPYYAKAAFAWGGYGGDLSVFPDGKLKTKRALDLLCDSFSLNVSGRVQITTKPDVPEGRGFGSSSAEVLAAISVVSKATGLKLPRTALQAFGWAAETANDPLLLGSVLYASREGRVIEQLGQIPSVRCLGIDLGRDIDTTELAERQHREGFSQDHIAGFQVVMSMVRRGISTGDRALIARAATQSAELNQEQIQLPGWDNLRRIAEETALGVAISHSGSACALLFDPWVKQRVLNAARERLKAELRIDRFYQFTADWEC